MATRERSAAARARRPATRPGAVAAAAAVACAASLACLHPQPRPPASEGDWAAARARFGREGKLYDGLAATAFARAVFQAPEVREARVRRLAAWKALPDEERDRMLAEERADAERADEFLLSLFTVKRTDNDLDAPESGWRVALVAPGEPDVVPERIESLRVDATLRGLYPAEIGDFDVVYRVRFPRRGAPLAGRPFLLRLASASGRLDLDWGMPR